MKTVIIIRHGKALSGIEYEDYDRPLAARGEEDAARMAALLQQYGVAPELIIASGALRAKTTAQIIAQTVGCAAAIELTDHLYDSSAHAYAQTIRSADDTHSTIMIVGHNPAISEVCEELLGGEPIVLPTCGVCCIDFEVASFSEIDGSKVDSSKVSGSQVGNTVGKKRFLYAPKQLRANDV